MSNVEYSAVHNAKIYMLGHYYAIGKSLLMKLVWNMGLNLRLIQHSENLDYMQEISFEMYPTSVNLTPFLTSHFISQKRLNQ